MLFSSCGLPRPAMPPAAALWPVPSLVPACTLSCLVPCSVCTCVSFALYVVDLVPFPFCAALTITGWPTMISLLMHVSCTLRTCSATGTGTLPTAGTFVAYSPPRISQHIRAAFIWTTRTSPCLPAHLTYTDRRNSCLLKAYSCLLPAFYLMHPSLTLTLYGAFCIPFPIYHFSTVRSSLSLILSLLQ